jgi:hypothetical protein
MSSRLANVGNATLPCRSSVPRDRGEDPGSYPAASVASGANSLARLIGIQWLHLNSLLRLDIQYSTSCTSPTNLSDQSSQRHLVCVQCSLSRTRCQPAGSYTIISRTSSKLDDSLRHFTRLPPLAPSSKPRASTVALHECQYLVLDHTLSSLLAPSEATRVPSVSV